MTPDEQRLPTDGLVEGINEATVPVRAALDVLERLGAPVPHQPQGHRAAVEPLGEPHPDFAVAFADG